MKGKEKIFMLKRRLKIMVKRSSKKRWGDMVLIGISYLVLMIFFGGIVYGESVNIYGLMDFKELTRIINEKEVILKERPTDIDALKVLGIAYHNLSVIGKKGVCEKAFSTLTKAYELTPQDYEILVYLGSSRTLMGRDAIIPFAKLYYVYNGCRIMDEAVSKSPDNIIVRLTRANNSLALPDFFNRAKYAKKDLLYLLNLSKKKSEIFPPDLLATIYYTLGEYYKGKGESQWDKARECWEKAIEIAPESKDGILSSDRLEVYKP